MTKKNKILWIFIAIIWLLCLIGFLLTSAVKFIVAAIISTILCIIEVVGNRKKEPKKGSVVSAILVILLVMAFQFSMPPLMISSNMVWQYPFQTAFVGIYQNIKEPDWFPDFTKEVEDEYQFDYVPSVMQGTGYYSVRFVTDSQCAKAYATQYEEQAIYKIPLREYSDGYRIENESLSEQDDTDGSTFMVSMDEEFWAGYWNSESTAMIYVLESNFDWNHPRSSVVIIDTANGKIQFIQEG